MLDTSEFIIGYAEHIAYHGTVEPALIFYVVYGKHGLYSAVSVAEHIEKFIINRYERSLPIVAMQHIGHKIEPRQNVQHRATEKRKTLAVVAVTVQIFALKVVLVVYEIKNGIAFFYTKQSAVLIAPRQVYKRPANKLQIFASVLRKTLVER